MSKIWLILRLVWFCVNPFYRRKLRSDAGFWLATNAVHYLLMKDDCDRNDLEAARLLNDKAKELCHP